MIVLGVGVGISVGETDGGVAPIDGAWELQADAFLWELETGTGVWLLE